MTARRPVDPFRVCHAPVPPDLKREDVIPLVRLREPRVRPQAVVAMCAATRVTHGAPGAFGRTAVAVVHRNGVAAVYG